MCIAPGLLWPLKSWPKGIQFISKLVPQGLPSVATRFIFIRGNTIRAIIMLITVEGSYNVITIPGFFTAALIVNTIR